MEIKLDPDFKEIHIKQDSMDIPDCFGEYDKKNKLCITYCALSIKCCTTRHTKPDIFEKLLISNEYSPKPH